MATTDNTQRSFATRKDWNTLVEKMTQPEIEPAYRRQSRRYAAEGNILATCLSDLKPMIQTWDLRQVSAEGLTARSPRVVPEYTRFVLDVNINEQAIRLKAKVRHCTQTVGGYKIGLEILFDD